MATNRVRDLLLRITGDPSDAERALHDVAREVGEFGRLNAEATLDVNTKPVEAGLLKATAGVRKFGELTATAKIDLQVAGAEAQLARLRTRLEALQRQDASPKIDIQVAKTVAQIERVEAKLTALGRRKVNVDVDVDRGATAARGLGAITEAATNAARGVGVLFTALSGAIPIVGGVGRAFAGAAASGASLGPVFIVLIPVVLALAAAIGVTLVAALGSLVASLAAAAAGVAVLGLALAAAFGPVLLVAIAAFSRLAAILKAVKESEEQAATQARRVRDAHAAQTAAVDRLRQANQQMKTTSVDAYRAMRDAAEEASDAVRGITDAELSRERAQLTLKQAKKDLADYRREAGLTSDSLDGMFKKFTNIDFKPKNLAADIQKSAAGQKAGVDPLELADKILSVREAQQQVANATDGVSDAVTRSNDAREKEAEFNRKGILAYPAYATAVKQAADAQTALAKTTTKLNDARADQGKQLDKLSPLERRFATTFERLKGTLQRAFGPATDKIFQGVLDFFDDLDDFVSRRGIQRALTRIGDAIGSVFRTLGRELRRKEVRDAFIEFANAAARMIRALGQRGAVDVFLILLRVARAALPYLEKFVSGIVDWLDKLAGQSGRTRTLERIIRTLVDHFRTWWGLAKEVARTVFNFLKDSAGPGRDLAESIRKAVRDFNRWMEANPGAIKDFFKTADERTKTIADSLKAIADSIKWIIDRADDFKKALDVTSNLPTPALPTRPGGPLKIGQWIVRKVLHRQEGGEIPGSGLGDIVPLMAEPGEFVIRKSIAQAIGAPRLHALNAGQLPLAAASGRGGITIQQQDVHLPAAPGHDQMGDARHQAAQFARELRRRGGQSLGGGGLL